VREEQGGRDRDADDERVLRLDHDALDVPRVLGHRRVRVRAIAELEQLERRNDEREPQGDDQARQRRRAAADPYRDEAHERSDVGDDDDGDEAREPARKIVDEPDHEQPAEHREGALREVHDPGRAMD
jgi:hypothetical protein